MLAFPASTEFGRVIPKESFYRKLTLSGKEKENFVSHILKIIWTNKLSADTLNVARGEAVGEILVLRVELKVQDYDRQLLARIAKENAHRVLFVPSFEGRATLGLYAETFYETEWMEEAQLSLPIAGLNLDRVWEGFVRHIAIRGEVSAAPSGMTLMDELRWREERAKVLVKIEKLEKKARAERQPRRKHALVEEIRALQKGLEC